MHKPNAIIYDAFHNLACGLLILQLQLQKHCGDKMQAHLMLIFIIAGLTLRS